MAGDCDAEVILAAQLRTWLGDGVGKEISRRTPGRADPDAVLDRLAEAFGVERSVLLHASRGRGHRNPARAVAMLLCLRQAGLSQREVAKPFVGRALRDGGRDHPAPAALDGEGPGTATSGGAGDR